MRIGNDTLLCLQMTSRQLNIVLAYHQLLSQEEYKIHIKLAKRRNILILGC